MGPPVTTKRIHVVGRALFAEPEAWAAALSGEERAANATGRPESRRTKDAYVALLSEAGFEGPTCAKYSMDYRAGALVPDPEGSVFVEGVQAGRREGIGGRRAGIFRPSIFFFFFVPFQNLTRPRKAEYLLATCLRPAPARALVPKLSTV